MSPLGQKSADVNNFRSVFKYFLVHLKNSDSKKLSCQISAQINNIDVRRGGSFYPSPCFERP